MGSASSLNLTFGTKGGNGGEIAYEVSPKNGVSLRGTTLTFTDAGTYTLTATQEMVTSGTNICGATIKTNITVTKNPVFGIATIDRTAFDVTCGDTTSMASAATITLGENYNLTKAITVTASDGFLVSTNKTDKTKYAQTITLTPTASGENAGKITGNVYVRAYAASASEADFDGTITFTGDEITDQTLNLSATVTCPKYTLTFVDRGGVFHTVKDYAGTEVTKLESDPTGVCTEPISYVFDGWAEASVAEGSTSYTKVTFPYTMPKNGATLYAVYRYEDDGSGSANMFYLSETSSSTVYYIGSYNSSSEYFNAVTNISDAIPLGIEDGKYLYTNIAGVKTYISHTSSGEADLSTSTTFPTPWTITDNGTTIKLQSTTQATRYLGYGTGFRAYAASHTLTKTAAALYTTSPACGPHIGLSGDVKITSAKGVRVDAYTKITVSGTNLNKNTGGDGGTATAVSIKAESNNANFKIKRWGTTGDGNDACSVNSKSWTFATNISNANYADSLCITYTPTGANTTETATITITAYKSNGSTPYATKTITVQGRSLPEQFVIAVTDGKNNWYAVPADMVAPWGGSCSSGLSTYTPYPITVDNTTTPTALTGDAPARAVYTATARTGNQNTNPQTLSFKSVALAGGDKDYYLYGSSTNVDSDGNNTNIQNASYSESEKQKWFLDVVDWNTKQYNMHVATTLNTQVLAYTIAGGANNVGQYDPNASTTKKAIYILPVTTSCNNYNAPEDIKCQGIDATNYTIQFKPDRTKNYEVSLDGSSWSEVTTRVINNCTDESQPTLVEADIPLDTYRGKTVTIRVKAENSCAESTTVTVPNPSLSVNTGTWQTMKGVAGSAFSNSENSITISDLASCSKTVSVSSSNPAISAAIDSETGVVTLTMTATNAVEGKHTTTLTFTANGATERTQDITITLQNLATMNLTVTNRNASGVICNEAATITTSAFYTATSTIYSGAWGSTGTYTLYNLSDGTYTTSGFSGAISTGVVTITVPTSKMTVGKRYKMTWTNTQNLTDASGLKYANAETAEFVFTENCSAPTATEPCVTGSESAVINWAGGCDAYTSTVSVYEKSVSELLNNTLTNSGDVTPQLWKNYSTKDVTGDWLYYVASGSAESLNSYGFMVAASGDKVYAYTPQIAKMNGGTLVTSTTELIVTVKVYATGGLKLKCIVTDQEPSNNTGVTTGQSVKFNGVTTTEWTSTTLPSSYAYETVSFTLSGITSTTSRIAFFGSATSNKIQLNNVVITSVSTTPVKTITDATCAEGNKEITGLSANTTYYATVTNDGNTSNEVSFKTYASGTKSLVFKSGVSEVTEVMVLGGESQHTDITVAGQYLAGCDITTNISAGYSVDESDLIFNSATGKVSGTVVFTLTDPAVTEGTYTITDGVGTVYTLHLTSTNCPAGFNTMATDASNILANSANANWTSSVTSDAGSLVLYKNGIVERELIQNGGFESDLTGWDEYTMGTYYGCDEYAISTSNKHDGSKCLKVTKNGTEGFTSMSGYSVIYANHLTLEAGTYRMSAWVKVDGDQNDQKNDFKLAFTGGGWNGIKSQPQAVFAQSEVRTVLKSEGYVQLTAELTLSTSQTCHPVVAVHATTGTFRTFYLDDVSLVRISAPQNDEPYQTFDLGSLSTGTLALDGLNGNTEYAYKLVNADGCESNIVTFVTAAAEAPTISVASPVSISAPMGSSSSGMAIVTVTDAYDAVAITSCNDGRITLGSSTLPAEGGALNFTFRPKDGTDAPGDKGTCTVAFITHGMSTPTTLDIEWTVSSGMDPGTELIEVTDISNQEITIEHNVPGKVDDVRVVFNREVSPDDVDENVGDEIFFSKYYEAYMQKKLWAIYNPTGRKISLEGMEVWRSQGSEKDGYSWNHTEAMDLSTMGQNEKGWIYPNEEIIVYTSNEVGTCEQSKADMSTWEPRSSEDKALSFSGDDALLLVRKKSAISAEKDNELPTTSVNGYPISWPAPLTIDAEQWYMLDIIGARSETYQPDCSACKRWSWTNCVKNESVSGDADGWVGYGFDMSDNKNNYSTCEGGGFLLSTNRCLLVRRMDVKSGANALAINIGNMETLNTEWKGSHVPTGGEQAAVSCENFSYVGGYDYAGYYNHYVPLTEEKEYTSLGKNPDGSWSFETEVPNYYCKILRIEVVEKQTINGVEADNVHAYIDYKVPIVVDNTKNTTDKIFKFGGDTCANCDVVIRDKAQLSHIIGGQGQFRDMYVYPGAKLSNEAGQTLQMRSIYMQALNDTVSYAIVENNTSTILSDKVVHTKRIDDKYWYPFSLPYDCDIAAIRQLNGKSLGKYEGPGAVEPSQYGTWTIKYYDGQARQKSGTSAGAGNASNFWIEMPAGGTLKAHQAYLIGLYETDWKGQHKTVLFPPKAGSEYTESGVDKKETTVVNWPDNLSCAARHHGWNFVGSPYISMFNEGTDGQGMNNGSVVMKGKISGDDTPYIIETDYVFLSIPDGRDTRTYTQVLASATKIEPFKGYFVQVVDPTTGVSETKTLEYAKSNRTLEKAPARAAVASAQKIFVELNILAPDAQKDNAGILVADHYTASYEIGGDLTKMYAAAGKPQLYTVDAQNEKMAYQALPEPLAHAIPLEFYAPTAGQYILSIARGASRLADAQAVRLLYEGSQVADLLTRDYTISATGRGIVSGYTIDIQRAPEVSTWVQDSEAGAAVVRAEEQTITIRQIPDHATVQIVDMLGRVLLQQTANSSTMHYTVPAVGVYQVVIRSHQTNQVAKVIVK